MNKLITIGVVGIAAYGIFNVLRMKNVADEMQASISNPRIHKVDFSGLTLKVDALISNPTKDSMSITKPVVTLTSNGKTVATTKPENVTVKIQPLTQSKVEGIELNVGWTTLIPFISGIVSKIPTIISGIKNKNLSIGKLFLVTHRALCLYIRAMRMARNKFPFFVLVCFQLAANSRGRKFNRMNIR